MDESAEGAVRKTKKYWDNYTFKDMLAGKKPCFLAGAVVSIATDEFGAHAVVVDKIENGRVFVRDPLPLYQGSSYSVALEDFKTVFNYKFVTIK